MLKHLHIFGNTSEGKPFLYVIFALWNICLSFFLLIWPVFDHVDDESLPHLTCNRLYRLTASNKIYLTAWLFIYWILKLVGSSWTSRASAITVYISPCYDHTQSIICFSGPEMHTVFGSSNAIPPAHILQPQGYTC